MKLIEQLQQLDRLDRLIDRSATGSPSALSRRFNVSERQVYRLIDTLRYLGGDIKYSRERQTYYYQSAPPYRFAEILKFY